MTARQTAKHSATVIVGSPIILQCVKAGASLGRTAGALRVTLHQNFTPLMSQLQLTPATPISP
jgi:hypothetical protein